METCSCNLDSFKPTDIIAAVILNFFQFRTRQWLARTEYDTEVLRDEGLAVQRPGMFEPLGIWFSVKSIATWRFSFCTYPAEESRPTEWFESCQSSRGWLFQDPSGSTVLSVGLSQPCVETTVGWPNGILLFPVHW